jgi:hypothetical protein
MVRLVKIMLASAIAAAGLSRPASAASPKPAFYYWRTQWAPSPALLEALARSGAVRLYIRFFDVEWDGRVGAARPVAPILFSAPVPAAVEPVPVVYLTDAVFLGTKDVDALADRVWAKVEGMSAAGGLRIRQMQIDCDWSEKSRERFFRFAASLRACAAKRGVSLSATIRLHQVKYFGRTGVPPVDRGMLMFYNMGRLEADGARPSIFNSEDAGKYASFIAAYPLPLDLALPIFSWLVQSREGRVVGLLKNSDPLELEASGGFARSDPEAFRATKSFFLHGRYFKEGDALRVEETGPGRTLKAASLAARGAAGKPFGSVAFFALDDQRMKHYAPTDFAAVLRVFK